MKIIGHKKQINFLESILGSEKIPQAYLFSGPESLGKFFIAEIFADSLNRGRKTLFRDDGAERINNANVEILSPETTEKRGIVKIKKIEIERVREVQKRLSLYPLSGKFRILIIDGAHNLSVSAQNALLKILEEPNGTAVIILVTHEEGAVLDTIKSRCQKLNFNLVALDDIRKSFAEKMDEKEAEKLSIFSMGRPGEAERLIKGEEELEEKEVFLKSFKDLSSMDLVSRFDLAENYSKNIPKTSKAFEFWIWFLRVRIFSDLEKNKEKIKRYYQAIERIDECAKKIKNPGLNSRLIIENLFLDL
ncbi:MAG: AAA family ATPase [Candidatus Moranbacteria bacterium]|nr:AAA family ATPase [Candidatus Moranbacteria bacterium]